MKREQSRRPTLRRWVKGTRRLRPAEFCSSERDSDPALAVSRELARATAGLRAEIGERQRAEQVRLQLLNRLICAEEEERRRIARELHDQCGQHLTALRLQVGRLKAECGGDIGPLRQVDALAAIVARLDRDIDFLLWDLRPTALDGVSLREALTTYVQHWSTHYGIPVELHAGERTEARLTSKIRATFYRIAQEALTNIAKHAGAEHVDVVLEQYRDYVALVIEDDGVGFDRGNVGITGQGLGLLGMHERAALVAGTLLVESAVGRGTMILVRVQTPALDQA